MRATAKVSVPALLVVALLIAPSALSRSSYAKYPSSMVVLAHSGATGYDSDPRQPRTDIKANSWATGTNRAVNSVYLRILAKNPRIKGHNVNLAEDGATVVELLQQAKRAVTLKPKPELVLVQIMDNDIRLSGDRGRLRIVPQGCRRVIEGGRARCAAGKDLCRQPVWVADDRGQGLHATERLAMGATARAIRSIARAGSP